VLHGGQRTGKTSILLQLEQGDLGRQVREGPAGRAAPVYINMLRRNDPGPGAFLRLLAAAVSDRLTTRGVVPAPIRMPNFEGQPRAAFEKFLRATRDALRDRNISSLVLMVDEFERLDVWIADGSADPDTFDYLRALIQAEAWLVLIVAGHRDLMGIDLERRHRIFGVAAH